MRDVYGVWEVYEVNGGVEQGKMRFNEVHWALCVTYLSLPLILSSWDYIPPTKLKKPLLILYIQIYEKYMYVMLRRRTFQCAEYWP